MIDLATLRSHLATIWYKGWDFRLDEPLDEYGNVIENAVTLTVSRPGVDSQSGRTVTIARQSTVHRAIFGDGLLDFDRFVYSTVVDAEVHEAGEWFTVAGLKPFDEHGKVG